jgi:voltage-gated potassium channel
VAATKFRPMATRRERQVTRLIERLTLFRAVRIIILAAIALVLIAGGLERLVEPSKFTSLGLAYWWAVQTVTTVGYGDIVPRSVGGRVVAGALMLVGIALIPTLTSVTISALIAKRSRQSDEEERRTREETTAALLRIEQRLEKLERGLGG